jgi:hypothetical protein
MKYPGACLFEFQIVMQILTKCMLRWDTKIQSSRGKGILGTVVAIFCVDEEQGRKNPSSTLANMGSRAKLDFTRFFV